MKDLKVFEEFKTFSAGVQFFVPDDAEAYAAGKPCNGFGSVRYGEGSLYCGGLYFDGKNYNKLGFGRQDFMLSELGSFNTDRKLRKAFYIGSFDYRKTDWIYGDGVMYYVDGDNRPACFVKGFFEAVNKVGEYQGEFSYASLADGFTPDMEQNFDEWHDVLARMYSKKSGLKKLKNLFIGDSHFEFWSLEKFSGDMGFYTCFDGSENLDIGVGGTRFCDWLKFLNELKDLPAPERVFINLGFNDIHGNRSAEQVYKDYLGVYNILKKRFPAAQIFLLNIAAAPVTDAFYAEEEKFNGMTKASSADLGVKIIDMRSTMAAETGVYFTDKIHFNSKGYKIFAEKIKSATGG